MNRSSRPRKTAKLSASVQKKLNMYALVATAAGVASLALPQAVEAKVVYTPIHRLISPGKSYDLDLNHDGITDFTLLNHATNTTSGFHATFYAEAGPGNAVQGHVHIGRNSAFALDRGARIGPKRSFPSGRASLAYSTFFLTKGYRGGGWFDVTNRFLGLKFKIHGKTHYGWARLTVKTRGTEFTATLTGYAYETIAGKGIIAGQTKGTDDVAEGPDAALTVPTPQPPSLGALALGAPGLSIWKREQSPLNAD
jgi:hypothetical protein